MRNLLEAGRLLLLDMAATLLFLVLYLLTHNVRSEEHTSELQSPA